MRVLALAMACLVATSIGPTSAWARGSKADEAVRPPPLEPPAAPAEWQWLPSDGVAPGLWISHPPLEFAVDVLGVESMQRCAVALEKGTAACALQLSTCQRLVLPKDGKLRLELDSACMAREATGVRLQLQTVDETST